MGWFFVFIFVVAIGGFLLTAGKLPKSAYHITAAGLFLGAAGYAWQGQPSLPGSSISVTVETAAFDESTVASRNDLGEQFGSSRQWLVVADALNRSGRHKDAANYLRNGVRRNPKNSDIWAGLGSALVAHAKGVMTPPAQYAFDRAKAVNPDHPAPPFFLGLAHLQGGRLDEAEQVWRALLTKAQADDPWREDLESRLQLIENIRADQKRAGRKEQEN